MTMKLQLALDRLTQEKCFALIQETAEVVDIVEIGTGVIKEYGMAIVRDIHKQFPDKSLFVDMKTCDAGRHEAYQAFEAGASYVTAMAFAADQTIQDMLLVAKEFEGEIVIDLLNCSDPARVRALYELGARHFCLHIGKDMQSKGDTSVLTHINLVSGLDSVTIYIAGGINLERAHYLDATRIDVAIVGSGITANNTPGIEAQAIRSVLMSKS